jgi:hypothetical protein
MKDVIKEAVETIVAEERARLLTAGDLLRSPLFGLWKDREDIVDSLEFARKLRTEAEQRGYD